MEELITGIHGIFLSSLSVMLSVVLHAIGEAFRSVFSRNAWAIETRQNHGMGRWCRRCIRGLKKRDLKNGAAVTLVDNPQRVFIPREHRVTSNWIVGQRQQYRSLFTL